MVLSIHILYMVLLFQLLAIQRVFVSVVEAFKRSLGAIMAVVSGRVVFGERVRSVQVVAVLVMVVGVSFILA